MIKEKISNISLDKLSFYALLDKLNENNVIVEFSYYTKDKTNTPFITIENVRLKAKIDTSSEFSYIGFECDNVYIDFSQEYIEYETTYLYDYSIDKDKIKYLSPNEKNDIEYKHLIGWVIPEVYIKRNEVVTISIKNNHYATTFTLECSWELFDSIMKNIDSYRNDILLNISNFRAKELQESKNQPRELLESIDNMLDNIKL